jgi:hypothetical protein
LPRETFLLWNSYLQTRTVRHTGAMHITPNSDSVIRSGLSFRSARAALALAALSVVSLPLFAQTPGADDANRRRRGEGDRGGAERGGGDRGNFNPQDMQARLLAGLRERLEITDDEEWKLISERIAKVSELRRNTGGGFGGMAFAGGRGGPPGGGSGGGGSDSGRSRAAVAVGPAS